MHELCNIHHYLVPKHAPSLATIGRAVPTSQLSGEFGYPSRGTRYMPEPQNEPIPTVIKVAGMDPSPCEDRLEMGCTVSEIQDRRKRYVDGSGRAYSDFSTNQRKKKLASLVNQPLSMRHKGPHYGMAASGLSAEQQ